jgi:hypothetical protein
MSATKGSSTPGLTSSSSSDFRPGGSHTKWMLMATALLVCQLNAGHSQMSAALFERVANARHRALSAAAAKVTPNGHVHP